MGTLPISFSGFESVAGNVHDFTVLVHVVQYLVMDYSRSVEFGGPREM